MIRETKMIANKRFHTVTIEQRGEYYFITTPFALKDEIKAMKGAKWMGYDPTHPESKWRVDVCRRNNFTIEYLEGKNPYAKFKASLDETIAKVPKTRMNWLGQEVKLFNHQPEFVAHMLVRRQCIIAGEMGTAKTLAAFIAMEMSVVPQVWYVAPKSALTSVQLDYRVWKCQSHIRFMTYDELKRILKEWVPGTKPPVFVVMDESSRVKNATSQRSQAAYYLAESMRDAYGDKAYIIEMSGSPAPKEPVDWYHQCEIACPGYIKEGDIYKFRRRLAVMEAKQDNIGFGFSKVLAWKDGDVTKCNRCGQDRKEHDSLFGGVANHEFEPMTNEVNRLYVSMNGLVMVKFKKDCLDLPEKLYRVMRLKPSLDLLRAARLVQSQAKSAIQQMTLLRELSDGFQYRNVETAVDICTFCEGNRVRYNDAGEPHACEMCDGTGSSKKVEREIVEVESPKIDALQDLLEENEETGRIVIYAGFTGSIDRICREVIKQGWQTIRVDGRGWHNSINPQWKNVDMLQEFQNPKSIHEKIAFIGHPGSAGMGLTLTRSSMIVYYSNDFNAESRIQSEDRIHRAGMDASRGATIVDLILLPTDMKVLDNLRKKRTLQSITMNELASAMEAFTYEDVNAPLTATP